MQGWSQFRISRFFIRLIKRNEDWISFLVASRSLLLEKIQTLENQSVCPDLKSLCGTNSYMEKSENGHMPSGIIESLKEIIYRVQKAVK